MYGMDGMEAITRGARAVGANAMKAPRIRRPKPGMSPFILVAIAVAATFFFMRKKK